MRVFFPLLVFSLFFVPLRGQNYETLSEGPIHEAFVTQEYGDLLLEAIPIKPPADVQEESSNPGTSGLMWIPGYWSWSKTYGDYIWVSGVWRKPPPGRHWVSGYWKKFSEGWVWIQGFWNESSNRQASNVSQPPPDLIDENIPPAPQQDLYFWAPGYWKFDSASQSYVWISGRWEALKEHWVYVPFHYLWRENGYVGVSEYWDYTLEDRGVAFHDIHISPSFRAEMTYHPSEILQPIEIAEMLYPNWPNYLSLFRNHFYFHRDLWNSWGGYPPWWNWNSWWGFTWQDNWWIWWWWTHPGYPNPPWITEDLASKISRAPSFVLKVMKTVTPPQNVTPNGVAGNYSFIKALQITTGKPYPILPSDPKQVQQIQELAKPNKPKIPFLEPTGKGKVLNPPKKPFFGPSAVESKDSPQPKAPIEQPSDARINLQEKHETSQKNNKKEQFKTKISNTAQFFKTVLSKMLSLSQMPGQNNYIDIQSPPELQGPPLYYNPMGPTPFAPGHPTPPHLYVPRVNSPVFQGSQEVHYYNPMHMEHHEHIMYNRLELENPPGPSVHPLPGDDSTLPDR